MSHEVKAPVQRMVRGGIGVLVVDIATNTTLLLQRHKGHDAGKWTDPGGKIDFGETARQAAVRETGEEIGLKINPSDLIEMGTYDHIDIENNHHFVGPAFLYVLRGNDRPVNMEPEKHRNMMMFDMDHALSRRVSLCDPTVAAIEMYKELLPRLPIAGPWKPPYRDQLGPWFPPYGEHAGTVPDGYFRCPLTGAVYGNRNTLMGNSHASE